MESGKARNNVGIVVSHRESRFRMARSLSTTAVTLALMCWAVSAAAQQAGTDDEAESLGLNPMLSLDPTAPSVGSLPGGTTPSYGQAATGEGDWRFDFHGFFTMPMVAGVNERADRSGNQSATVLHAPPMVPDDKETFSHTGVIPTPYVQLNFSYGNSVVTGNVQLLAEQATISTGFFDPTSQSGVNDVFLSLRPDLGKSVKLQMYFGAFSNRYGSMGEYDEGRYGTPLIARTNGVGENLIATVGLSRDFALVLEHGIQGQTSKAPADITPDGWNGFADPNAGTSFVNHLHAGVNYRGYVTVGAHYMHAWSQDDQATGTLAPDGSIGVLAGDLRLTLGRFGHLYVAGGRTKAKYARTVSRVIEVMNTKGGAGLIENYLGEQSDGNGELFTVGAQYDLSIGRLVSYPVPFYGDGPDIVVSGFGVNTQVRSDDSAHDKIGKLKYGVEGTYSLLSWLAASLRYDRVVPDVDADWYSFAVLSPRLIFRTDWQSTDQVVLGYSRYINGELTTIRTGYPPHEDPTAIPDQDVVSLSASMWW